jgi:hypothetical protein
MTPSLTRFEKIARAFRNAAFLAACCFAVLEAIAGSQWVPIAPIPATGNIYPIHSKGGIVYVQEWLFDVSKIAPWGFGLSMSLLAIGICLYGKDLLIKR